MLRNLVALSLSLLTLLMTGCAIPTKMAFDNDKFELNPTKSLLLMTANITNDYKPKYQPKLIVVNVEKSVVNDSEDRINFTINDDNNPVVKDGTENGRYLISMELDNGEYVFRGFTSNSLKFPVAGFFFTPIHETIKLSKPGVYYLGHIDAVVRERKDDEFKAGSSVPLIDQAVVGASGGTFDIDIADQWDRDEGYFLAKYNQLQGVNVEKMILPSFDRARAQKWWEEH